MRNLKTFEDFINVNKSVDESKIESSFNTSKIVSEKIQKQLYSTLSEAIKKATEFEDDDDNEHTFEQYLKETAMVMGSAAASAMHGDDYFNTMTKVSSTLMGEDYTQSRDELKEYLDTCIDSMKEAFCNKLDEYKKTNHASSTLITKKVKENRSKIYK